MSQHAHLSTPDPEFQELWSELLPTLPPPEPLDVASQRHEMATLVVPAMMDARRPHLPAESSYRVKDHDIPVPGGAVAVRCIQPVPQGGEEGSFPILVWFHGGGWICGELDGEDFYFRMLGVELRLSIVIVDYRLAPEHPFPTGLNDCYAALKWAVSSAPEISGSPAKGLIAGGVSAGAHYAAAVAHRARDDPFFAGRTLTGHVLQVPIVVHPAAYPEEFKADLLSMEQNKDAPNLRKEDMNFCWDCLGGAPSDAELSPLLLPHVQLAPAYIQVTGLDPLRDEGLLYARLLRENGVSTRLDIYPGLPHVFHLAFPQLAASRKWEADFRAGLKWLLSGAGSG
ncbi:Alpha/Beta hydrolase protein [Mycena latifolia]|nr:Alpha/Beta hydrolase protein [Mycena latifolia]